MANVYQKGDLVISAGTVYDDSRKFGRLIAKAEGGKIVKFYEKGLTDAEKQYYAGFVAEAHAAKKDKLYGEA